MIPKKLKVGGFVYEVVQTVKPLLLGNAVYGGIIHYNDCKMEIQIKNHSPQISEESFCHELVHAMTYEAGITLDEDETNRLSHVLYQIIKDNKIRFK